MLKSPFNKKIAKLRVDEFGVKHHNMFYNEEEDRFFCLLDASNKEAIEKHHDKYGLVSIDYRSKINCLDNSIAIIFYKLLGTYISNNN
jgi:hypothetical protein